MGSGLDRVDTPNIVDGAVTRAKMAVQSLAPHRIRLDRMYGGSAGGTRFGHALYSVLNGHLANANPGDGTTGWGHGAAVEDILSAAVTNSSRTVWLDFDLPLPVDYVDGGAITIRVNAERTESGSPEFDSGDAKCELEVFAYKLTAGALGGSIGDGTPQQLDDSAPADYDFTVTPTGIVRGDLLRIAFSVDLNEDNSGGSVAASVFEVHLLCDRKV